LLKRASFHLPFERKIAAQEGINGSDTTDSETAGESLWIRMHCGEVLVQNHIAQKALPLAGL
jgi:hypothetical protein